MTTSPLSRALIDRAASVATARGVAVRIEARGIVVTVLPDPALAAQPAPGEESEWDRRTGASA